MVSRPIVVEAAAPPIIGAMIVPIIRAKAGTHIDNVIPRAARQEARLGARAMANRAKACRMSTVMKKPLRSSRLMTAIRATKAAASGNRTMRIAAGQ